MTGQPASKSSQRSHTLSSILREMDLACADLEEEIEASESETQTILQDLESTVGDLSDLRYGKFSQPLGSGNAIRVDMLDGLHALEKACSTS